MTAKQVLLLRSGDKNKSNLAENRRNGTHGISPEGTSNRVREATGSTTTKKGTQQTNHARVCVHQKRKRSWWTEPRQWRRKPRLQPQTTTTPTPPERLSTSLSFLFLSSMPSQDIIINNKNPLSHNHTTTTPRRSKLHTVPFRTDACVCATVVVWSLLSLSYCYLSVPRL